MELVFLASTNARQMASMRVAVNSALSFGEPTRFPSSVTGDRLSADPRSFDLLPDGRLIGVVTRYESGRTVYSDLRVVLNWMEEFERRLRLGAFREPGISLKTTNLLESIHAKAEARVQRVDHRRNSDRQHRWLPTALPNLELQLRHIRNHQGSLPLRKALQQRVTKQKRSAA